MCLVLCNFDIMLLIIEYVLVEIWMKFFCVVEIVLIENEKKNLNVYKNDKNMVFVLVIM